jgi:hypothetical protein
MSYTVDRGAQVELKWERVYVPTRQTLLEFAAHHGVARLGVAAQVENEGRV